MAESNTAVYNDTACSTEDRAQDLLGRMNLTEKIGQLDQYVSPDYLQLQDEGTQQNIDAYASYPDVTVEMIEEKVRRGEIGSFLHVKNEKTVNRLQTLAAASRLGIPLLIGIDAIHGNGLYRPTATIFPAPLCLSCSFDTGLAERVAAATAKEMRAAGYYWTFSPNVEVCRDPRWGRAGETFGEDCFTVSRFGEAFVKGYQGGKGLDDDNASFSSESVLACIKHFAAGGAPEGGLNAAPMDVSGRTLESVYLPPFEAGVRAGAATLMAAHHALNSVPCHCNAFLLTETLRKRWGFNGFTVSDWLDIERLHHLHHVAETPQEAYRMALEAGCEVHMHGPGFFEAVTHMVSEGILSEAFLDRLVLPILKAKIALGLFEESCADKEKVKKVILSDAHKDLALEAARKSIVLLKNDTADDGRPVLPITPPENASVGTLRILVTGPNADKQTVLGDWVLEQPPEQVSLILDGIKDTAPAGCSIAFAPVKSVLHAEEREIKDAETAAAQSDLVLAVMGENGLRYDPEANCGENKDRSSVELPGNQREFLKRLHACGKPLVLILVSGRPLALSWEKKNLPALIMAGEPGREGGRALAEILFGAVNPSAKLTMTFPRSSGHLLQNYDHEAGKYFHTYADDESGPCFPFGHGLSYTRFECSGFTLPERIGTGDDLPVEVRVKNSGERAGEEVILLYLSIVNAPFTRPERRLVGFKRIFVNAGEEKEAKLTVCNRDLAILNAELQPVVLKGRCRLQCGNDGPVKEFRIE